MNEIIPSFITLSHVGRRAERISRQFEGELNWPLPGAEALRVVVYTVRSVVRRTEDDCPSLARPLWAFPNVSERQMLFHTSLFLELGPAT